MTESAEPIRAQTARLPGSVTDRVMAVLSAFARHPDWGVRELAAELGLPKSGVHRTLQELAEGGYLVGHSAGYRAGPALARLAAGLTSTFDLPRAARPHLDAARDESAETVILTMYDGARAQFVAIAAAESAQPVRYNWNALRGFNDLHRGASGKGILAFLPIEEREHILEQLPDPVLEEPRRLSKQELRAQLDQIRERGWASSTAERYPGARGVAAPVRNARGEVVGDVLIAWADLGPDDHREPALAGLCIRTAQAISHDLGAQEP